MKNLKKVLGMILACGTGALGLTACNAIATTTAQCAYVVGNGQHDRNIHKIVLPGDQIGTPNQEDVQYIPCSGRNYIINDGQQKNANNDRVGDSDQVVQVWTKEVPGQPKVQMNIFLTVDWMLNQSDQSLHNFYPICYKYTCYNTDSSKANDSNFSTKGWNGMLSEKFDPVIRTLALTVVSSDFSSGDITQPANWLNLGNELSGKFAEAMSRQTGLSNPDLFCGTGSSFTDSDNKNFDCRNVRFTINKVEATDPVIRNADNTKAQQAAEASQTDDIVANAKKLYGDNWAAVLGWKAVIDECRAAEKATCVVNTGSGLTSIPTPK